MDREPAGSAKGPQIAIFRHGNMGHTCGMTQHAHARALNLLADNGIDPETSAYIMKRLYDFGFTVRTRDTSGGASPPVAGAVSASDARARIRAEVAAAREEKERERQAAIAAENERRAAEDAARERQLAVAAVLASMD